MDKTTREHMLRREPAGRWLPAGRGADLLSVLGPAALIGVLGWTFGGYYPEAWGRLILVGAAAIAVLGVLRNRGRLGPTDVVWVGLLGSLAAWQLLSNLWTTGHGGAVADAELTLVYAVYALVFLLLSRRSGPAAATRVVAGIWLGLLTVSVGGLRDHLFPTDVLPSGDRLMGSRLAEPVGYANATGIVAAVGLMLALGYGAHRRTPVRLAAFASVVPFAAAFHLSLSRGATWAAAAGILLLAVVSVDRLEVGVTAVLFAIPITLAITLGNRHPLLVNPGELGAMRHQGETYLWELVGALAVALALGFVRGRAPVSVLRHAIGRRRRLLAGGAALVVGVVVVALALGAHGSHGSPAGEAGGGSPSTTNRGLNGSLFTTGGDLRRDYWHVALRMVARSPIVGEGAGSFERWWTQERWAESGARNAHNLYLEMLAELGPIGLLLVLGVVGVVLRALRRARRGLPTCVAAIASIMVFVQALLDWDWEIPLVMIPALALGAVAVAAHRRDDERTPASSWRQRTVVATSCLALAGLGVVIEVGNRSAASAEKLLPREPDRAIASARRAERWMPWSIRPGIALAEARRVVGDRTGSRSAARAATRADPESWRAWYDLALVTDGAEQQHAADRAHALSPLNSEVDALLAAVAP